MPPTFDDRDPAEAPRAALGVRGLPAFAGGMNAGGIYVLTTETPPARIPLLAGALGWATVSGQPATLVVAGKPEQFLGRLASNGFPDAQHSIETGKLGVFVQQGDFSKKMFRFGAAALVGEFERFGFPKNGLVVFDQADELLGLNDLGLALEQIEALHRWAEESGSTVLLSFVHLSNAPQAMNTLMAMADHLAGIARLNAGDDGLELTFDYWQSHHGAIAARNFPVQLAPQGYAVAEQGVRSNAEVAEPLAPAQPVGETRYFYLDRSLAVLDSALPGHWSHRESLIALLQACQGSRTPTVLLTFTSDTSVRELAQTVHTLRISVGRGAKILVFERGASLRYANEALLLNLGANLIVHRGSPESRWPLAVQSIEGQTFDREISVDFDTALASVSVTPLRGYLLPMPFAQETMMILERAAVLNVPGALVVARAGRDLVLEEILDGCRLSRAGDLLTCDGEQAYFFFAGCPASSLRMTLERALGQSTDALLSETRSLTSREDIQRELASLGERTRSQPMPDLRDRLAGIASARVTQVEASGPRAPVPLTRASRIRDGSELQTAPQAPAVDVSEAIDLQRFRYGGRLAREGGKGQASMARARRPLAGPGQDEGA